MPRDHYDHIVIGAGSMGSAASYYLARGGNKVLALEQFGALPHENGSHAGQSRIIRKAYFEHPDYVPLLFHAYQNWNEIERISGQKLFFKCGLVYKGPANHSVIRGVLEAGKKYNIPLSEIASSDVPGSYFRRNEDLILLEEDAGFVLPEKTISTYLSEAKKNGAEIRTSCEVLEWAVKGDEVELKTNTGTLYANRIVITAGAWSSRMLKQFSIPLTVTRQVLVWVEPGDQERFVPERFPCWVIAETGTAGVYYGFPFLESASFPGPSGLKFAWHHPADPTDPNQVDRDIHDREIQEVTRNVFAHIPALTGKVSASKTCLYTNTPDENFIVDVLPGTNSRVIVACGFSGHGFKFVPVMGEILADLATKGRTQLPIDFLSLKRFL
jgi:sarcosine oxidase